jgi:hypothetical protein
MRSATLKLGGTTMDNVLQALSHNPSVMNKIVMAGGFAFIFVIIKIFNPIIKFTVALFRKP